MSAARYWHTIRHLQARQNPRPTLVSRLSAGGGSSPDVPTTSNSQPRLAAPDWREPSLLGPDSVTFLNVTGTVDWNDALAKPLWLFNLHYFDDLTSRGSAGRRGWHEAS